MLLTCIRGRQRARVPPPPFGAERRLGYPQANFLFFFLPYPITPSISPFFLSLRGFLFLCVYFPTRVSFRVSEGKKNGFSYPICIYAVIIRSILIFCYFLCCVSLLYFPYCFALCVMFLHCLLLWMLCFSLICPFFCPLWGFLRFCV